MIAKMRNEIPKIKIRTPFLALIMGIFAPASLLQGNAHAETRPPVCRQIFGEPGAIPASENQPEIIRANGKVRVDWSKLLPRVEQTITKQDGHPVPLDVAVLVNGEERYKISYPRGETSIEFPDSQGNQRDYYLELRDSSGKVRHRTELILHESKNAQTVPGRAYAEYFTKNGISVELPASLKNKGIAAGLMQKSVQLGYEKTVWVLSPSASPEIRKLIGEREDIDVIPKLNVSGKPIGADIINKTSGEVLVKGVKPENFFFKVDAAFNGNCFFWDDMFVSMATIPHHPELAKATVEFWLAVQKMNGGAIPREVRKSNLKSLWFENNIRAGTETTPNLHYTNPYLIHRVADELYRYDPSKENLDLLKRVSESMKQYLEWMEKNRSVHDSHHNLVGFVTDALGSGGDNSRGERGNFAANPSLNSGWADLLAQQIDLHKHLVGNYRLFESKEKEKGNVAEASKFRLLAQAEEKKALSLDHLLNARYWNPETKFYYDVVPENDNKWKQDKKYQSVFGFWPLLSKSANAEQVRSMAATNLKPEKFGGDFPLPANSRDSTPYTDKGEDGYWNKWAHWPSVASAVMDGFKDSGRPDTAYQLATGFLKGVSEASKDTVYEFYGEDRAQSPTGKLIITGRSGQHRGHTTRGDFAGWGKVPPVYNMLTHVIGFEPQKDGHITENLMMPMKNGEEFSVSNIAYKGGEIRVLKFKRISENQIQVTVKSTQPFDLDIAQFRKGEGDAAKLYAEPVTKSIRQTVGGDPEREKTYTFECADQMPANRN